MGSNWHRFGVVDMKNPLGVGPLSSSAASALVVGGVASVREVSLRVLTFSPFSFPVPASARFRSSLLRVGVISGGYSHIGGA